MFDFFRRRKNDDKNIKLDINILKEDIEEETKSDDVVLEYIDGKIIVVKNVDQNLVNKMEDNDSAILAAQKIITSLMEQLTNLEKQRKQIWREVIETHNIDLSCFEDGRIEMNIDTFKKGSILGKLKDGQNPLKVLENIKEGRDDDGKVSEESEEELQEE